MAILNTIIMLLIAVPLVAFGQAPSQDIRSYEDLQRLLTDRSITSIDDLISHLPATYKNGHALIYKTQALGRNLVSSSRPRVLFFGNTGEFMMSINSHPSGGKAKPGDVEKLETIEFVGDRTFLRELEFDGVNSPLSKAVEVNPQRCLSCHGADPRGLWDPYNMWPGVYGSLSRGRVDFITVGSLEYRYFQDFLQEKKTNPRYSFISHNYDYLSQVDSTKLLIPYDPAKMKDALILKDGNTTFPNQIIGMIIGDFNLKRLGRILNSAPVQRRSKIQYLVEAIRRDEEAFLGQTGFIDLKQMKFECSGALSEFFPERKFRYASYNDFHKELMEMNSQDHLRQKALVNQFNHGLGSVSDDFDESDPFDLQLGKRGQPYSPVSLTHVWDAHFKGRLTSSVLAYVFYLSGLPYQELSTAVNAGRYNLYYGNSIECSGSTTHAGSRKCFYHGVDIFFERFLPKTFFTNKGLQAMSCEDLKAASRKAMRSL